MADTFARRVLLAAGIVGMFELLPLYAGERVIARLQPPAVTHPDFYYGFIGVAVAWQLAFVVMSRDPERYRPLLPAMCLEKLLYPLSTWMLFLQNRVTRASVAGASGDLVWLALFLIVWRRAARRVRRADRLRVERCDVRGRRDASARPL